VRGWGFGKLELRRQEDKEMGREGDEVVVGRTLLVEAASGHTEAQERKEE
jgi:hypothetical protein